MKKCISIDEAVEGMVLTKPVTSDKGMVLCSKGTALSESLIQRFKQMQVTRQSPGTGPMAMVPGVEYIPCKFGL